MLSAHLHHRPDFDSARGVPMKPYGDADRLVEILGIDQAVTAELLACLCERTIGHERFAVALPDGGGRRRWVQRGAAQILSTRPELSSELHARLHHLLLRVLAELPSPARSCKPTTCISFVCLHQ
jgi:hypothetical protein